MCEMGIVDGRASSVVKESRDKEHVQLMYPHSAMAFFT